MKTKTKAFGKALKKIRVKKIDSRKFIASS
jgi:hypothetical protein